MKPYGLVVYNFIRYKSLAWICPLCDIRNIQLLSKKMTIKSKKTSAIHIGKNVVSDGKGSIIVDDKGILVIGEKTYFNEQIMISCKGKITIGSGCKFGPNVKIFDNNHKFDAEKGVKDEHSIGSISIGKNSWIASNVVILKGAEIGDNCVIGAGCVINNKISANSIVTQSQTLLIRKIENKQA